jgi:hypothetical protein
VICALADLLSHAVHAARTGRLFQIEFSVRAAQRDDAVFAA